MIRNQDLLRVGATNMFFYHIKNITLKTRLYYILEGFGELIDGLVRIGTLGSWSSGFGLYWGEKALRLAITVNTNRY